VVVVGDLVTDVLALLSAPPAPHSDTPSRIRLAGGGSAANVAAWLARQGAVVHLVVRVGDDQAGSSRCAELRSAGVDVAAAVDEHAPTGTVVVLVDQDGARTMLADRGANALLQPDDLPGPLFTGGNHLHLSGYVLLDEGSRAAGVAALERARAAGMTISVDPSSEAPLRSAGADRWLAWTSSADLCLPNLAEARLLAGTDDAAEAALRLGRQYREVVVTAGADGALWSDGSAVVHRPAETASVVDTTGAGDAFTAGYLRAWVADEPVETRLDAGVRLAAVAVATAGARPGSGR
jgi:ribokinase